MRIFDPDMLSRSWRHATGVDNSHSYLADRALVELEQRYSTPERYYHNWDHIQSVVHDTAAHPNPEHWMVPKAVVLAAFLHDVIYDSRAKDNEERSAEFAQEMLASLGVAPDVRLEVARLILLTRRHETTKEDIHGQHLLDADLRILASYQPLYDAYAAAIRKEYAWVNDAAYREGRRKVLEHFLTRPHIYFTARMIEHEEAKARANLAREIASLS